MTKISKILNTCYVLTVAFFLLDGFTSVDIKGQTVKSFVYFGILLGTPSILILNTFFVRQKEISLASNVLPTMTLILILLFGPVKILFSKGSWCTQDIIYQNKHVSFKTVEFQIQDVGAFGYNKRTVQVFYVTTFFMIIRDVPSGIEKSVDWVKVDRDVNELRLKSI